MSFRATLLLCLALIACGCNQESNRASPNSSGGSMEQQQNDPIVPSSIAASPNSLDTDMKQKTIDSKAPSSISRTVVMALVKDVPVAMEGCGEVSELGYSNIQVPWSPNPVFVTLRFGDNEDRPKDDLIQFSGSGFDFRAEENQKDLIRFTPTKAGPIQTDDASQVKVTADSDPRNKLNSKQNAQGADLNRAPAKLQAILEECKATIDFRPVDQNNYVYDGCYWRMELKDDLLQAHIKHFDLKPGSQRGLTKKMLRKLPSDWPDISAVELQWYASPHNRDDGPSLQIWSIMAVDTAASDLYFFYQNCDTTP